MLGTHVHIPPPPEGSPPKSPSRKRSSELVRALSISIDGVGSIVSQCSYVVRATNYGAKRKRVNPGQLEQEQAASLSSLKWSAKHLKIVLDLFPDVSQADFKKAADSVREHDYNEGLVTFYVLRTYLTKSAHPDFESDGLLLLEVINSYQERVDERTERKATVDLTEKEVIESLKSRKIKMKKGLLGRVFSNFWTSDNEEDPRSSTGSVSYGGTSSSPPRSLPSSPESARRAADDSGQHGDILFSGGNGGLVGANAGDASGSVGGAHSSTCLQSLCCFFSGCWGGEKGRYAPVSAGLTPGNTGVN
jgi:hypothetical protein